MFRWDLPLKLIVPRRKDEIFVLSKSLIRLKSILLSSFRENVAYELHLL